MSDRQVIQMELMPTKSRISPLIFGHFIEFIENCIQGGVYDPGSPSADENGIRQDVLAKAQGLRPTILRWPGGTFANTYHWMDAIGPVQERKKRKNLIWGGIEDNVFGTAEFIAYCRKLGAEPMLCVNMASGTAEEAANWVEYCNGEPGTYYADLRVRDGYPEPFQVKYWCIGNESNAEPDLGAQHVPERYISDAWEFTKHMKLMDPSLKLIFVGDGRDPQWNKQILESLGPVCDYFSIHHYSGGHDPYGPFVSLRNFQTMLDSLIPTVRGFSMRKEPFNKWYRFPRRADDIKLCVDEWNIWNSTPRGENNRFGVKMVYNWRDALWVSCMMNTFARYSDDIAITNVAQMVNVLAPILTEGDQSYVQTVYHVMKLYRDHLGGRRVDCELDAPLLDVGLDGQIRAVDAASCVHDDGTVTLFVTNVSLTDGYELRLPANRPVRRWVCMSADSPYDVNTLDRDVVRTEEKAAGNGLMIAPGTVNLFVL